MKLSGSKRERSQWHDASSKYALFSYAALHGTVFGTIRDSPKKKQLQLALAQLCRFCSHSRCDLDCGAVLTLAAACHFRRLLFCCAASQGYA
jgi:hypothetical protein